MERLLAYLAVLGLALANSLGSAYYTYGLWPQNWVAFFGFSLVGASLIRVFIINIEKDHLK